MSKIVGSVTRIPIVLGALVVLVFGFFVYSGAVTFSNWPWTRTTTYTSDGVMGFKLGESKLDCFRRATLLERNGEIRALKLVGLEPAPHDEQFIGTRLSDADFPQARNANIWHLPIPDQNAWLLLTFEDEALIRLERKDYRGPTE